MFLVLHCNFKKIPVWDFVTNFSTRYCTLIYNMCYGCNMNSRYRAIIVEILYKFYNYRV